MCIFCMLITCAMHSCEEAQLLIAVWWMITLLAGPLISFLLRESTAPQADRRVSHAVGRAK